MNDASGEPLGGVSSRQRREVGGRIAGDPEKVRHAERLETEHRASRPAAAKVVRVEPRPIVGVSILLLRVAVYGVVLGVSLDTVLWATATEDARFYHEGRFIENLQFALVTLTSALLFAGGWWLRPGRWVLWCLACVAAFAAVRELDYVFQQLLPILTWKLPGAIVALAGLAVILRGGNEFWRQALRLTATPSFGLLCSGLFFVILLAQIFGQKEIWMLVLGDDHRPVKNIVEETIELWGYALLLIASLEALFAVRRWPGEP